MFQNENLQKLKTDVYWLSGSSR